jgi:hypothetical protein
VQAICGPPVEGEPGRTFTCAFDIAPACADVRQGRYRQAFRIRANGENSAYMGAGENDRLWRLDLVIGRACTVNAECVDSNPCNGESCVDGACRFPDAPVVADCCWAPTDHDPRTGKSWAGFSMENYSTSKCNDGDPCTVDTCSQPVCGHKGATTCAQFLPSA